jgi:outer membrane immunogenic protein
MRRLIFSSLALIAFNAALPARAADIPPQVPTARAPAVYLPLAFNWTGFYIGAHGGWGWARFRGGSLGTTDTVNGDGALGGGQLGFNYQVGSWVFGGEADMSYADIKHREEFFGGFGQAKIDRLTTAAARIGYAFDRTLLYGKFGGAWTREKWDFGLLGGTATASENRAGWLAGVGLEHAITNNWSAKIEYNYLDMGTRTVNLATAGGLATTPANVGLSVQTVKLGVNYRFGWGGPVAPLLEAGR